MKKIYFFDIDDCLIHTSALRDVHKDAIRSALTATGVTKAQEITDTFVRQFHLLYSRHQGNIQTEEEKEELTSYLKRLEELESPVIEKFHEPKKWSREVCLFVAGEKHGVILSKEQLTRTVDALWQAIGDNALFYPEAKEFLTRMITLRIPFYLVTSSDGRLLYDESARLFEYDPDYARESKFKRLHIFLEMGVPKERIFVGDPVDKPDPWVFLQALQKAQDELKEAFIAVMVGDSLKNDLLPSQKAGYDEQVLILREKKDKTETVPPGIRIISSLNELHLFP